MQALVLSLLLRLSLQTPDTALVNACNRFNQLNTSIRDGLITEKAARPMVIQRLRVIKNRMGTLEQNPSAVLFPLSTYNIKAVGGHNGNGYVAKGYNFFRGNRHGGHPAHDIFIADKNQDIQDDHTRKPVEIRTVADGIVVALEKHWQPGSALRGGKYVIVYHPAHNLISYYAHLSRLSVTIGQQVKAGESIALLGRTGLNAYKKRSPTHLHLMVLKCDSSKGLIPVDPYKWWQAQ